MNLRGEFNFIPWSIRSLEDEGKMRGAGCGMTKYCKGPQRTTTDYNGSPRPDPAARALATQAAGCPALGISERSVSGASALGFSLVRVISSHMVRCSPLRSVVVLSPLRYFVIPVRDAGCGED